MMSYGDTGLGSPPRVRGIAVDRGDRAVRVRITPACAGNRICAVIPAAKDKDHPRVCGE